MAAAAAPQPNYVVIHDSLDEILHVYQPLIN